VTGRRRSRSAASRSRRRRRRRSGAIFGSTLLITPGHVDFTRRGGAEPAACSTARSRSSTRLGRPAAVGDGLAPGGQVQGPSDRLHQQDGPHRRELLRRRAVRCATAWREPRAVQIPIGRRTPSAASSILVEMKAIVYKRRTSARSSTSPNPTELTEQAHEYHHQADRRDSALRRRGARAYIEDEGSVTPEQIPPRPSRRHALGRDHAGAARLRFQDKGVQPLLDALIDYLPSPLGRSRRCTVSTRKPSRRPSGPPRWTHPFRRWAPSHVRSLSSAADDFRVYAASQAGDRVLNHEHRQDRAHQAASSRSRQPPRGERGDRAPARSPRASA